MVSIRRYSGGSMRDASGEWSRRPPLINYWIPQVLSGRHLSPKHCPVGSQDIKVKNTKSSREILGWIQQVMIEHRLIQCFGEAHASSYVAQIVKENINKINTKSKQYMAHAEIKCRKIKSGKIPFPPESILWIKRWKAYRYLMGYHAGKN